MRRKPPPPPSTGASSGQSTTALCSQEAATFTLKTYHVGDTYAETAAPILRYVDCSWIRAVSIVCCLFRVSVWHDILGSFSSYFHGEVRVPVNVLNSQMGNPQQPFRAWYSLTPRSGNGTINNSNNTSGGQNGSYGSDEVFSTVTMSRSSSGGKDNDSLGSLRLKITYTVDHILPLPCYNELWRHLLDALAIQVSV